MRKKMSDLYISKLAECEKELRYYDSWNDYLNVIEGTSDDRSLADSLRRMVHYVRRIYRNDGTSERPMILIDEVSRPLLYGAGHGFEQKVQEFLDELLNIDHYEFTAGIITTSYAPVNVDVCYDLKFITNKPVNDVEPLRELCIRRGIKIKTDYETDCYWNHRYYFGTEIDLRSCYENMIKEYDGSSLVRKPDYDIVLVPELKQFVSDKRKWIAQEEKAFFEAEKKRVERERKEYAMDLNSECHIPSVFAGVRRLQIEAADEKRHEKLNNILRKLYDDYGSDIKQQSVYDFIQGIDRKEMKTIDVSSVIESLKAYADSKKCFHRCWIDTEDSYWGKFDLERVEREEGYGDLALVKIYLSVADTKQITVVFEDVLRFLIDNGKHLFHAKVSRMPRNDHICLWIGREDFFLLEDYIIKYDKILFSPLPFVAYRKKLGISREFYSWESHNGVQSELISLYLKNIGSRDEIDVIDMYSHYTSAWNGDAEDDDPFTDAFKRENAQALLILLESLNVIMGNEEIGDDHLLLNGDGGLWHSLGNAKNWYEVDRNYRRECA
ncbi:MAG: hypothetical protein K6G27_08895 [Lachnospiraceae bacterium]|nr:hypothetical protein [Lachnospiraceae bacterium]